MLPKIKQTTNKGFTLIEVLITILILGIMAAIAGPSFMTWVNNKKIDQVATNIEGALKEAQSTAVRKSISCTVSITAAAITATNSCLPSGSRDIEGSNNNLAISGTGGATTTVTFSSLGTVTNTQAFVVYRTDVASTTGTKRCVVISSGIGTTKAGRYTGTFPLPSAPTAAQITTISNDCTII
jgi:prepilin-type N-terminal cleavage/methylation domain-containing protein